MLFKSRIISVLGTSLDMGNCRRRHRIDGLVLRILLGHDTPVRKTQSYKALISCPTHQLTALPISAVEYLKSERISYQTLTLINVTITARRLLVSLLNRIFLKAIIWSINIYSIFYEKLNESGPRRVKTYKQ